MKGLRLDYTRHKPRGCSHPLAEFSNLNKETSSSLLISLISIFVRGKQLKNKEGRRKTKEGKNRLKRKKERDGKRYVLNLVNNERMT